MKTALIAATIFTSLTAGQSAQMTALEPQVSDHVIASRQFSMLDRYPVASVNEVFKKNILLNLAYLDGTVTKKSEVQWEKIEGPTHYEFTLKPGEVFAFHDNVLDEYKGKVVKTTHAFFSSDEGFVSDGYLVGDGVCHFASLINWAAQDAHLGVLVTKNHDFAVIGEVPKAYGVSIFAEKTGEGAHNNLYITNTKDHDVTFHFEYQDNELTVYVTELQVGSLPISITEPLDVRTASGLPELTIPTSG